MCNLRRWSPSHLLATVLQMRDHRFGAAPRTPWARPSLEEKCSSYCFLHPICLLWQQCGAAPWELQEMTSTSEVTPAQLAEIGNLQTTPSSHCDWAKRKSSERPVDSWSNLAQLVPLEPQNSSHTMLENLATEPKPANPKIHSVTSSWRTTSKRVEYLHPLSQSNSRMTRFIQFLKFHGHKWVLSL